MFKDAKLDELVIYPKAPAEERNKVYKLLEPSIPPKIKGSRTSGKEPRPDDQVASYHQLRSHRRNRHRFRPGLQHHHRRDRRRQVDYTRRAVAARADAPTQRPCAEASASRSSRLSSRSATPRGWRNSSSATALDNTMPGECLLRRELCRADVRVPCQRHSCHLSVLPRDCRTPCRHPLSAAEPAAGIRTIPARCHRQPRRQRRSLPTTARPMKPSARPRAITDTRDMLRRNRDDAEYLTYQYEQPRADESPARRARGRSKRSAMSLPTPLKSRRILPPPRPSPTRAPTSSKCQCCCRGCGKPRRHSRRRRRRQRLSHFAERPSRRASRFRT